MIRFASPWLLLGLALVPLVVLTYWLTLRRSKGSVRLSDVTLVKGTRPTIWTRLRHAPIALRLAKEALLAGLERPPGKGYEVEAENFGRAAMTEDAMVGIMSFVQKQQPDFKGK